MVPENSGVESGFTLQTEELDSIGAVGPHFGGPTNPSAAIKKVPFHPSNARKSERYPRHCIYCVIILYIYYTNYIIYIYTYYIYIYIYYVLYIYTLVYESDDPRSSFWLGQAFSPAQHCFVNTCGLHLICQICRSHSLDLRYHDVRRGNVLILQSQEAPFSVQHE